MSEKGPLLKLKGICKRFPGVQALNNVELEVYAGEVHGLLGENGAGKSTLIKILTGAHPADEGEMYFLGQKVEHLTPKKARDMGIACIYQELNLVPHLSVAENIFLGREPCVNRKLGLIDRAYMHKRAKQLLQEMGLDIDPGTKVESLGIGKQQMVEIARALSVNARLIIMDEPTSSLSEREVEELLNIVLQLKNRGVAVIYISHRLEEIKRICDRITVLRDGQKVATREAAGISIEEIIRLMVGRDLSEQFPKIRVARGKEALAVENLTRKGVLHNISFKAYQGEVLGIAGLVGSGRTELVRAIFGADPVDAGTIRVFGKTVNIRSPRDAIKAGIALLTEDRKGQGLILIQDITFNTTLVSLSSFARGGILNIRAARETTVKLVKELKVRPPYINQLVGQLSGGNQQKVVISKWLCSGARIFIFDEPTRGIDVGAKVEVYNLINQLVSSGAAVIMVSSELPEVLGMSDRILVMHEGRITAEFERSEADQEKVMHAATGGF